MIANWINQHAHDFAEVGLHFLWQATAIFVLAWTINCLLFKKPGHRATVYLIALVMMALAVPVTFMLTQDAPRAFSSSAGLSGEQGGGIALYEGGDYGEAVELPRESTLKSSPTVWIMGSYLMGLIVMFFRVVRGYLWSCKVRKNGHLVHERNWPEALARAIQKMKLKSQPVMIWSEHVTSPIVTGFLRPVIVLPVSLMSGLPMSQAEAILSHELAHLRRFDHAVVFLQRFLEALFFFHPAVWLASRFLEQEREKACDDLVVQAGSNPADYAEALVLCSGTQHQSLALAASGNSQIRDRVLRLLGQPEAPGVQVNRAGWVTIGLMICGLVLLTLSPVKSEEEMTEKKGQEVEVPALERPLDRIIIPLVDFEDVTLEEALEFLRARSREVDPNPEKAQRGVNFLVRAPAGGIELDEVRIDSLHARNMSLRDVLSAVCLKTGFRYKIDKFAIIFHSAAPHQAQEMVTRTWKTPKNFYDFINPKDAKEERASVRQLLELQGVLFPEGSAASLVAQGETLIVKNTPANLDLVNAIVVAARNPAEGKVLEDEPDVKVEPNVLQAIIIPVIDFKDTTLEEAVDFLRVRSRELDPKKEGVNINIFAKGRKEPLPMIDSLLLKKVPLSVALQYICDTAQMRYVLKGRNVSILPLEK